VSAGPTRSRRTLATATLDDLLARAAELGAGDEEIEAIRCSAVVRPRSALAAWNAGDETRADYQQEIVIRPTLVPQMDTGEQLSPVDLQAVQINVRGAIPYQPLTIDVAIPCVIHQPPSPVLAAAETPAPQVPSTVKLEIDGPLPVSVEGPVPVTVTSLVPVTVADVPSKLLDAIDQPQQEKQVIVSRDRQGRIDSARVRTVKPL
jgi:hypothetical protein